MTTQDLGIRATGVITATLRHFAMLARSVFRRRRFKRLRDLDDHILEDIGVTRHEVEIATRLPFSHDAATELRRLANERRRTNASAQRPFDHSRTQASRRWP